MPLITTFNNSDQTINTLVEFDGPRHFTSFENQYRDDIKDRLCNENGFSLIRIPYFVQLCPVTFKFYFNIDMKAVSQYEYPHGFISKKVVYPRDFNRIGVARYHKILRSLPNNISLDIIKTDKESETKKDYHINLFWDEYQKIGGELIDNYEDYEYYYKLFYMLTRARVGDFTPFSSDMGFNSIIDIYVNCNFENSDLPYDQFIELAFDDFDKFFASIDNIHAYS